MSPSKLSPKPNALDLTDDERRTLRDQYIDVHSKSQDSYDESVRNLSAGGIAVTVSIVAALHTVNLAGKLAIVSFLVSLGATVWSHRTAQRDMIERVAALDAETYQDDGKTIFTTHTERLNAVAGIALLVGAILLAIYAGTAA